MPGLQDFIYALEVGNLRRWVMRLAVVLLLIGLAIFYMVRQFNGLSEPSAMDQAQIARQITQGKGFTTKFLRPLVIKEIKEKENLTKPEGNLNQPDMVNAPAYPYLLAAMFTITRTEFNVLITDLKGFTIYSPERVIVFTNILAFVMAVVVFYVWMVRAFDDRVAIVASILLAASDLVWGMTISGLPTSFLILLVCVAGFCINEALIADEGEAWGTAAVWWTVGVLAVSLMVLTKYAFVVMIPALIALGYLAFMRRGMMMGIALLLPVLLLAPWLIRNMSLTGHPFGFAWVEIFADNGTMPGESIWRVFGDDPGKAYGLKALMRAITLGVATLSTNLTYFLGGVIVPALFIAGLLHTFRRSHCQWSRWFWLAAFLLVFLANAPLVKLRAIEEAAHLNLLVVFLPVLTGFGVAFLFVLINRLQLASPMLAIPVIALVCVLQLIPLGVRLVQREAPPFAYPPYFPPVYILVGSWLDETEIQAMDVPWAGAWYSNRNTIWLPLKRTDFFALNDFTVKISSMLLTPYSSNSRLYSEINQGEFKDWASLIRRSDFRELPLPQVTVLPPNKDDFIYFSDRVRWR